MNSERASRERGDRRLAACPSQLSSSNRRRLAVGFLAILWLTLPLGAVAVGFGYVPIPDSVRSHLMALRTHVGERVFAAYMLAIAALLTVPPLLWLMGGAGRDSVRLWFERREAGRIAVYPGRSLRDIGWGLIVPATHFELSSDALRRLRRLLAIGSCIVLVGVGVELVLFMLIPSLADLAAPWGRWLVDEPLRWAGWWPLVGWLGFSVWADHVAGVRANDVAEHSAPTDD